MPNKEASLLKGRIDIAPIWLILTAVIVGVGALFLYIYSIKGIGQSEPIQKIEDQKIQELENLNNSDDVGTIEKDLNSTDVEVLDQGLDEAARDAGI